MSLTESIHNLQDAMNSNGIEQEHGLGTELFHFASTLMPVVNVDLLVIDRAKGILLSWRDDPYTGVGWTIPGRCIRFGESIDDAIQACAIDEIGSLVEHTDQPIRVIDFITTEHREIEDQRERAHFITLAYLCSISDDYEINNPEEDEHTQGFLKWFEYMPDDLFFGHNCYRDIFKSIRKGE